MDNSDRTKQSIAQGCAVACVVITLLAFVSCCCCCKSSNNPAAPQQAMNANGAVVDQANAVNGQDPNGLTAPEGEDDNSWYAFFMQPIVLGVSSYLASNFLCAMFSACCPTCCASKSDQAWFGEPGYCGTCVVTCILNLLTLDLFSLLQCCKCQCAASVCGDSKVSNPVRAQVGGNKESYDSSQYAQQLNNSGR